MSRSELEALLHIYGESLQSSPERISEILVSAHYSPSEISVLLTYRQNHPDAAPKRITGLHKVFRTDQSLAPEEINALLGVEVTVGLLERNPKKQAGSTIMQTTIIVVLTLLLAAFGLVFTMYFNEVGLFHEAAVFGSLRN